MAVYERPKRFRIRAVRSTPTADARAQLRLLTGELDEAQARLNSIIDQISASPEAALRDLPTVWSTQSHAIWEIIEACHEYRARDRR